MRIDPALQALRGDPAPQRQAQAAMLNAADGWRDSSEGRALSAAMDAYAGGTELSACAYLAQIFASHASAFGFAEMFIGRFMPVLARNPLGVVPARYSMNGPVATMVLAGRANVTLSLVSFCSGADHDAPKAASATFADGERHEAVLTGSAQVRHVERAPDTGQARGSGRITVRSGTLAAGEMLAMDTGRRALLVDRVPDHLLTLRLVRTRSALHPTCEYDLESGKLLHQSAADADTSGRELKLALLGRMQRAEAAPVIAQVALRNDQPDHLRWQALREALALDTREGFLTLCAVAREPADSLAGPAGALRAQLLESYPVLASLTGKEEAEQCPVS